MELVAEPSIIVLIGVSLVAMVDLCWMDPIISFLAEDRVLADEKETKKVRWTTAMGLTYNGCTLARLRNS